MKTFISNPKITCWSLLTLLVLCIGCGPDAERKERCRDTYNQCIQDCRKKGTDAMNVYHAECLECSNVLIAALNACDANNAPGTKAWSKCMIAATEAYQKCFLASQTKYDLAMFEQSACENECQLKYIECLYGE